MSALKQLINTRKVSTADALQIFDELPAVSIDFMIGRWRGSELQTGHKMDGLLKLTGWYGKLFVNNEEVHPLLFYTNNSKSLYAVSPKLIPLDINFPKLKILGSIMALAKPILKTKQSKARLRMVAYRGKLTATMVYDDKPIFDHFVKIDDNTVLGCMDLKNMPQPYFWLMERDDNTSYHLEF